ncbi:C40 family peptidase [Microvirga antarctica]|uniref:C40 family peptidase n=1 Tax=Microvirga antarctica TaxID=2819233 RepID=UPI001B3065EB|nr:NlpC/P60 family protein [Microvirga antarctica]
MTFDRRTTAHRPDLACESLRGQVSAERFTRGQPRQIAVAYESLHRHPSPDAPVDTQALFGERVDVFDERDGWAWVQLRADRYVGYVPARSLMAVGVEATHTVATLRTFVYPDANLKLPNLGLLSLHSRVSVVGTEGDFAQLATGGWVIAAHLSPAGSAVADFVAVAERFLHTPYLWGGKTSIGIDCSGLAQTALAAAGIAAPRDSDMQEREVGSPVEIRSDLSGLQRGDLIFWKGHVALMQDATRMIHATGHTMTVITEPLAVAEERIRTGGYGPITSIRRPAASR